MPATDELIDAANYAAVQSDRWLFVALLIVFFVAIAWIVKYFTDEIQRLRIRVDEVQTAFNNYLVTTNKELTELLRRVEGQLAEYRKPSV